MHPLKRIPTAFSRSFDTFCFIEARQNRPSCARRIPYKATGQVSMQLNALGCCRSETRVYASVDGPNVGTGRRQDRCAGTLQNGEKPP